MRVLILSFLLTGVFSTETNNFGSSNNKFAVNLFNEIFLDKGLEDDSNIFFSPFSTTAALCMTMLGAKGNTLSQMEEVLKVADLEDPHTALKDLITELENTKNTVAIANRLFGMIDYNFVATFLEQSKNIYGAELEEVDFSKPEEAREIINNWVEDETMNKIQDLIPSGTLSASVALVLTNAIYFQANWTNQFTPEETKDKYFYSSGKSSPIKMMNRIGTYKYVDDSTLKSELIEIPFDGEDFSYYVLLPHKDTHVKTLQDSLTHENIESGIQSLESKSVKLALPKFEVTEDLELVNILKAMGIKDLFSPNADLSGISSRGLLVSDVLHKAFIKVTIY